MKSTLKMFVVALFVLVALGVTEAQAGHRHYIPRPTWARPYPRLDVRYCAPPVRYYASRVYYPRAYYVTPAPVYVPRPVIYTPPPVVYTQPQVVVQQEPVVYTQVAPVAYAPPPPPPVNYLALAQQQFMLRHPGATSLQLSILEQKVDDGVVRKIKFRATWQEVVRQTTRPDGSVAQELQVKNVEFKLKFNKDGSFEKYDD